MRHAILFSMIWAGAQALAGNVVSLSGAWKATFDGATHAVTLPGSMLTNNLGDLPSVSTQWTGSLYDSSYYFNPYMEKYRQERNMKFPFFLTPNRHYVGTVAYSRTVKVPKAWKGRRVELFLERAHIETTVTINGKTVGHQMSLNTPHVYDVTDYLNYGRDNQLVVTIYNGIENVCVGQDSHSVTDQTQGNWNGVVGRMELRCTGRQPVGSVAVFPDIHQQVARVVVPSAKGKLHFTIDDKPVTATRQDDSTYVVSMAGAQLWSEFTPRLYHLTVATHDDTVRTTFGMREITVKGMQIYLNDNPVWIRGTVGNCDFPLTGFPPTDVESWKTLFTKCKQYGLNAMRFHSYCPPEAAFAAADEVGFYLQPEGPSWPNHGVKMNRGMYIDTYLMDETKRMTAAYGNHPSFVMMSAGNEPAGDWVTWGDRWVDYWKKTDSRRIYASFNVGGGWAWDGGSQYHAKAGARGLDWDRHAPQSTDDYYEQLLYPRNYKGAEPNNSPIIAHEQGQWCAFPDLNERSQYTGVYKAYNFDIFADLLRDHGMQQMASKFLHSSGKLQTLCYKYEIERNLRTKDYAGFMLLALNDYSGQGTALVGPLNVFFREKGYVDSTQWRQFCNEVVVMAEFPKFVFTAGEKAEVAVDVYNALGGQPLKNARLSYAISPSAAIGHVLTADIPAGKSLKVARVPLFTEVTQPGKYTLTLNLTDGKRSYTNTYDYWVYPARKAEVVPQDIYVTDTLDPKAVRTLKQGGKVLVVAAGKVRYGNDIKQQYLPVFWNTSWFKMRPPHTTGAYIDSNHPMFREFPTDDWSNLNWWELLNRAQVMNLSELPNTYQSPVQPIDTWHVSRKLGMVVEANVLGGHLFMTTMDITTNLDSRPVARQMRKAIIDYMQSSDFRPTLTLDSEIITDFFTKTAPPVNMYTNDSPDELKPKIK